MRVGLIGTSWWADSMYLPALAEHPRGAITAICGRDLNRAAEVARDWSVDTVTDDALGLIESGDIDAVIIASSNQSHHPYCMAALDARIHVLCEKPIGLTTAEADELAARAAPLDLATMVPFTYRWMPTNRWFKQLIDDGYIGRPYHLAMRYYTGYARDSEYKWRFDPAVAGSGVLGDLGSHWLHLARWFFGEVVEIGAMTSTLVPRDARPDGDHYEPAEDSAVINARFANGAYCALQVSAVCWEGTDFNQTHHFEAHGSDGTLYSVNDWSATQEVRGVRAAEPGPAALLPVPDQLWDGVRRDRVHDTYRDVFRTTESMTREWLTAASRRQPIEPDLAEGARVQRLVDAAVASAADGGRLQDVAPPT